MKKVIILLFLTVVLTTNCICLSISTKYYTNKNVDTVSTNFGVSGTAKLLSIPIKTGLEFIKFNSMGTIHNQTDNIIMTEQSYFVVPFSVIYEHKFKQIKLIGEFGYKMYFNQVIDDTKINSIENVNSISGSNLLSNYSEKIQNNLFYSIGIKFRLIKHINIQVSKTWSLVKNKITYNYLGNYEKEQESEFNYDPISISAQIYF